MRTLKLMPAVLLAIVAWTGVAIADPVTDLDNGVIYTLTLPTDANGVPVPSSGDSGYTATLTIDTSGFSVNGSVDPIYLIAAAIKLGDLDTSVDPTLGSAPGGTSSWDVFFGGTASGGCQFNDNNGFVCAQTDAASTTVAPVPSNTNYVFTFNLTLDDPLTALPTDSHVKAVYCDSDANGADCNVGSLQFLSQTSIDVPTQGTPPPNGVAEPGTLILLGASMLALVGSRRFVRR
jgi:hypothetical protein